MVDPIISGAGKASTELFKEAGKQMQNASEQVSKFEELRTKNGSSGYFWYKQSWTK